MRADSLCMEIGSDDNVYRLKTELTSAGIYLDVKNISHGIAGQKQARYNHDDDDENTSIIETALLPQQSLASCL